MMINVDRLSEIEKKADKIIKSQGQKFIFDESMLSERMMRCGVEERYFKPLNVDELRHVALVTLKVDFAKRLWL